ncbi:MAG: PAS domain-containing protein [Bacteroidota bacterium]
MYDKTLRPYAQLVDGAPLATAILHRDTFKLEMLNQQMLDIWNQDSRIVGIPLLEFLPEMVGQRYPEYLKQVCDTGKPFSEQGAQVMLNRCGNQECVYMDYSFTPIFGENNKTTAVLIMATDVCERELNRLIVQQSRRDLRALVMSAPMPMCVYRGPNFRIEAVNEHMLDVWKSTQKINTSILNHVFHMGTPYTVQEGGLKFSYTPLGGGIRGVEGVCVVASYG